MLLKLKLVSSRIEFRTLFVLLELLLTKVLLLEVVPLCFSLQNAFQILKVQTLTKMLVLALSRRLAAFLLKQSAKTQVSRVQLLLIN